MKLRKVLFWDTDFEKIDWDQHAAYVIERVARYGFLNEWKNVLDYYGHEKVKKEILKFRDLDGKTLNYLSILFNIPKERFRCYTPQQFPPAHYPS